MVFFIYFIMIISFAICIIKPYWFVIVYGLIGSDMSALGITGFFEKFVPIYSLVMCCFLFLSFIMAILRLIFKKNREEIDKNIIVLSILYVVVATLSLLLFYILKDPSGNFIIRIIKVCVVFGPGILIILCVFKDKFNIKKALFLYSSIQCIFALLIIYCNRIGLSFLDVFNAGHYNNGGYYLDKNNDMVAIPGKLIYTFIGKNDFFLRCGQFHNANGLGFASCIFIVLLIDKLIYYFNEKNFFKIVIIIPFIYLAFMLWCNAGTRGPIVGVFLSLLMVYLFSNRGKISIQKLFLFVVFLGIVIIIVTTNSSILNYFIGSGVKGSINSRLTLDLAFFTNLDTYFLIGYGGNIDGLVAQNIDSHILPFRILAMYGFLSSIIITILIYLVPIKRFLVCKKWDIYNSGLIFIVILITLTNNFAEGTLVWLCLYEVISFKTKERCIII